MKEQKGSSITKEKHVARVFFSSPFGGLEEERELLTKQYWPELAHLCQKAGYEFVPVDMRWGITAELSSEAATITICLRELDRSDMIVGFFGQRYGWHGSADEFLQKTFDHAIPRYPWLAGYRDRAVTELEFLHGHLNQPGKIPACFFFRDKSYDDAKLSECIAQGDERGQRKFQAISDGPKAAEHLNDLKQRVKLTEEKCLSVVMNYPTPDVGAQRMFETVRDHLRALLGDSQAEISTAEREHAQHETFLITCRGMGGKLAGGEGYLAEINKHTRGGADGTNGGRDVEGEADMNHLLLLGDAGCGKSCVIANWIEGQRQKDVNDILAIHFVGCTSKSTGELDILKHLCYQIEEGMKERRVDYQLKEEKEKEGAESVRGQQKLLVQLVTDASSLDIGVVIVIDALNKLESGGRAMREMYWLPKTLPPNVRILVSTSSTDTKNVKELQQERGYDSLEIRPLTPDLRSEVTKATLMVRGKELSPKQMGRVIGSDETGNPLYLFILLRELCSFGSFFELDDYINSLLMSKSTLDIFIKFLERLEKDYNPEGKDLVREVMCCLLLSHRGLSENELKAMLRPTNSEWSMLYFAMDDFLLEAEGLYRLAYSELGMAVEALFCPTAEKKLHYRQLISSYFMSSFKALDQRFDTKVPQRIADELPWQLEKSGKLSLLIECLSAMNLFLALSDGQAKYDLISYWEATNLSGQDIVKLMLSSIDDQVVLSYLENEKRGGGGGGGDGGRSKTPAQQLIPLLVKLTDFLDDAGYGAFTEPLLLRVLQMHKSQHTMEDVERDMDVQRSYCELQTKLACHYASVEKFDRATEIHKEVLALTEKYVDKIEKGKSYIAVTLTNLGYISQMQHKFPEAEDYMKRALVFHQEMHGKFHDLVATSMNSIGMALYGQGKYQEAAKFLEESLQIYEEVYFGQLPPDIGGTYLNFAMCSARLAGKDLEDVEPLYKRALEIRINAVGPNHPSVGQTYTSYGAYLMRINQPERGLAMTKDALRVLEIANGREHQSVLMVLENIALFYLNHGQQSEAHPYYQRAGEALHQQGRMDLSLPFLNSSMIDYYLNNGREDDAHAALARIVGTSFATARDFAALDYLDCKLDDKPERPYEHSVDRGMEKFPQDKMLLGRKLIQLAPQGAAEEILGLLERGGFGAETYNESYSTFVAKDHRQEGLKILEKAAEKFPTDMIILENLAKCYGVYQQHSRSAEVLAQGLDQDPENLDFLVLRVRMLGLGNELQRAKDLIAEGIPLADRKGATEARTQLENYLRVIDEVLGTSQNEM